MYSRMGSSRQSLHRPVPHVGTFVSRLSYPPPASTVSEKKKNISVLYTHLFSKYNSLTIPIEGIKRHYEVIARQNVYLFSILSSGSIQGVDEIGCVTDEECIREAVVIRSTLCSYFRP